jgi:hypothetical protein
MPEYEVLGWIDDRVLQYGRVVAEDKFHAVEKAAEMVRKPGRYVAIPADYWNPDRD